MGGLVVRPVQHTDVSQCVGIRVATLGSLVIGRPPPYPGYVEEAEAAIHDDLDSEPPHVRHLKVVDPDDADQVKAYAKWEIYKEGRPDLENLRKLQNASEPTEDEFGKLRKAAHEYFSTRNGKMGEHPHLCEFHQSKVRYWQAPSYQWQYWHS